MKQKRRHGHGQRLLEIGKDILIVFLVLFSSSERVLEYVLVICFAWLLQFAMTIPCIVREKFRLIPGLHFRDPDLKLFARTTVVTVFTTSIFLLCLSLIHISEPTRP